MHHRKSAYVFSACALGFPLMGGSAVAASPSCASLASLLLPYATVTIAKEVTSGSFTPPGSTTPITGLPPFCRVAGDATPTIESHIGFEVWIPLSNWNGKYEQVGNGGYAGSIPYSSIASGLQLGYAAAGTNDGHTANGLDATWALGHPQLIVDFGYRALKATTDNAKAIITAFTSTPPSRSYFNGCSDGGREALMEAERYPDDFDGILAGSPANFWTHLFVGFVWDQQALEDKAASYIPSSSLPILSNAALKQCVGKDGGVSTDAFLNDPRNCHFNPAEVTCTNGQSSGCFTPAQVTAAQKIYDGPVNPTNGAQIYPGYSPTEGTESNPADWPAWITGTSPGTGLQEIFGDQFFANMVFDNPNFNYRTLDFTNDVALADRKMAPIINSTNPDLSRFHAHGGKLIQYVGWSDDAISPYNDLNYFNSVVLTMSGNNRFNSVASAGAAMAPDALASVQGFYRLFMAPGMAHCSGGPGANSFGQLGVAAPVDAAHDLFTALDKWVENGVAPNQVIATKYTNDDPTQPILFQRPLCVYPMISHYNGGNPNKASSFSCVPDADDYANDVRRATQYLTEYGDVLYNPPSPPSN
jgi:Tannase and feruloyl esterase